jgi:hypothetical protein
VNNSKIDLSARVSSTSGGRSVGIVRLRTKDHGVCLFVRSFVCTLLPRNVVLLLALVSVGGLVNPGA